MFCLYWSLLFHLVIRYHVKCIYRKEQWWENKTFRYIVKNHTHPHSNFVNLGNSIIKIKLLTFSCISSSVSLCSARLFSFVSFSHFSFLVPFFSCFFSCSYVSFFRLDFYCLFFSFLIFISLSSSLPRILKIAGPRIWEGFSRVCYCVCLCSYVRAVPNCLRVRLSVCA